MIVDIHDKLSRTIKMAIDTGEAATINDAENIFKSYQLAVEVGSDIALSATLQVMLLTIVNTARRCFLGGVHVQTTDAKLLVPWNGCETLHQAIIDLRGNITEKVPGYIPRIIIGDIYNPEGIGPFAVRATFDDWRGGVLPFDEGRLEEKREFTPAGVLAGALAVSEAFQHVRGGNPIAGRRDVGLSLWNPASNASWLDAANAGPQIEKLPSKLWLIGLGHLGQAMLWTLGFLPYARPDEVFLVLNDFDVLSEANDSTSPLTFAPVLAERKTRAMARWCEARGFKTMVTERSFSNNFKVAFDEPTVAFCGVDNALARSVLEDVGFDRVIEAGLGKGEQEYLSFQIHTFPGPQKAKQRWKEYVEPTIQGDVKPAYKKLAEDGMDECGIVTLAGRSVGASFVGTMVASLAVAELLKLVLGVPVSGLIDGTLRSLERREVIGNPEWSKPFNPGVTDVLSSMVVP